MIKRFLNSDILTRIAGRLLASYIRFVFFTSKIVRSPEDTDKKFKACQPLIFAMWHGQFLMIPKIKPKFPIDIQVMVARHRDAEIIGRALERFDMGLLRGAGAGKRQRDRGGATVLRAAIKALKTGSTIALTADIPPGPAKKAGRGIVSLARLSGRPVVPCAIATSRSITLNTWNRFTINLPFSKLAIVVGDPIFVARDGGGMDPQQLSESIEDELNRVTRRAYELAGADSRRLFAAPLPARPLSRKPGFRLKAYQVLTRITRPLAPLILTYRMFRGKEDPTRGGERRGRATIARPSGFMLWFHAASVGETNAILPLIDHLQTSRPELKIILTTGTPTSARLIEGRRVRPFIHQFVPLDSPTYVARFLDHWQPDLALFTESEIWPNLILQTAKTSCPLILLNGRMSKKSFRKWRQHPSFSAPIFSCFDLVLAQNPSLAKRFQRLGVKATLSVGNLKIDAPPLAVNDDQLKRLQSSLKDRKVLVAASTHPGEEEMVAEAHREISATYPDLLTIIVPRHPQRGGAIENHLTQQGFRVARRRALGALPCSHHEIYIADTLDELGTFYSLAPVSFIGGSLIPHGGQNPIEAIKLGSAVLSGPHWHNFKDIYADLLRRRGCCEVSSPYMLAVKVQELWGDKAALTAMNEKAEQVLSDLGGALALSYQALEPFLPERDFQRVS